MLLAAAGIAAVIMPLARGGERTRPVAAAGPILTDDAAIDAEVERYRAALRAGTICAGCRFANPAGSRYCADCGRPVGDES